MLFLYTQELHNYAPYSLCSLLVVIMRSCDHVALYMAQLTKYIATWRLHGTPWNGGRVKWSPKLFYYSHASSASRMLFCQFILQNYTKYYSSIVQQRAQSSIAFF